MIQNRFSNSNFVARKEGSVVAAVSVAKLIERFRSCRRGTLCLRHGYSAFFCWSSDHPLALVRLSKIMTFRFRKTEPAPQLHSREFNCRAPKYRNPIRFLGLQ